MIRLPTLSSTLPQLQGHHTHGSDYHRMASTAPASAFRPGAGRRKTMQTQAILAPKTASEEEKFRSTVLYCEVKLNEIVNAMMESDALNPAARYKPNRKQAALICHLMDKLSRILWPPLQRVFWQLQEHIVRFVYSDYYKFPSVMDAMSGAPLADDEAHVPMGNDGSHLMERVPFFDVVHHLESEKEQLEAARASLEDRVKELEKKNTQLEENAAGFLMDIEEFKKFITSEREREYQARKEITRLQAEVESVQDENERLHSQIIVLKMREEEQLKRKWDVEDLKIELRDKSIILGEAEQKIENLQKELQNSRPLRDFEIMDKELQRLQVESRSHKTAYEKLKARVDQEQSSLTPRPAWEEVVNPIVPTGYMALGNQPTAAHTNSIITHSVKLHRKLERAAEESGGGELGPPTFAPLGKKPPVPKFLQTSSQVRNLKLLKVDALSFISNLWTQRSVVPEEERPNKPLFDLIHRVIKEQAESWAEGPSRPVEFAYSLKHAFGRFKENIDCEIMKHMFDGTLHEDIYHMGITLVSSLRAAAQKLDKQGTGEVGVDQLATLLKKFFPTHENQPELKALLAYSVRGASVVSLEELFPLPGPDLEDGRPITLFINTIRKKFTVDTLEYMRALEMALVEVAEDNDNLVTSDMAKAAFCKVDALRKEPDLTEFVCIGFGCLEGEEDDQPSIPPQQFYRAFASKKVISRLKYYDPDAVLSSKKSKGGGSAARPAMA
eukprot:Rmarinus@m.17644